MASYHFRLKSDKKPNGTRISSFSHVMYVNRQGSFKNADAELELYAGRRSFKNLITGKKSIIGAPKKEMLLYSSPYGKIKLDAHGIRLSADASSETCAIALAAAQKIFGDELTLSGSQEFEERVLSANAVLSLGAHFADVNLEIKNERRIKEREEDERYDTLAEGAAIASKRGRVYRNRFGRTFEPEPFDIGGFGGGARGNERLPGDRKPDASKNLRERSGHPGHNERLSVQPMRRRNVAVSKRGTSMLLSDDELLQYSDRAGSVSRPALRRAISRSRTAQIKETAEAILKNLQQSIGGDFAYAHLEYINREAAYENRGGCVMTGNFLPKWANGSAMRFFHAADRFERANGERYKEIVFSLPNELPVEKSKEILDRFLEKHLKDHYYAWAIHEKVGSMSEGERHPHVHIIFSTREVDYLERYAERPPEQFFMRYNAKDPVFSGAQKLEKWNGKDRKDYLWELREDCARITNEVLKENGIHAEVSHLSLLAQKLDAEARGDMVMAEILDRIAETHVNPAAIVRDDPVVAEQKRLRKINDLRLDRITNRELEKVSKQQKEAETLFAKAKKKYDAVMEEQFEDLPAHKERLEALQKKLEGTMNLVEVYQAAAPYADEVYETAVYEVLDKDGQEAWDRVSFAKKKVTETQEFRASLVVPPNATEDEEIAVDELLIALDDRLDDALEAQDAAEAALRPYLDKLEARGPKKTLQMRIHHHLFASELSRHRYQKTLRDLADQTEELEREIAETRAEGAIQSAGGKLREDLSMTLREISAVLSASKQNHDARIYRKTKELSEAKKAVFSFERIMNMAENVYFEGKPSALRYQERELKKQEAYVKADWEKLEEEKKSFQERSMQDFTFARSEEGRRLLASFEAEEERLRKKEETNGKQRHYIDKQYERMEEERDTIEAEKKITSIAIGIMKKNRPKLLHAKKLAEELDALITLREASRERLEVIGKKRMDPKTKTQRFKPMPTRSNVVPPTLEKVATVVADHLNGTPRVALIAKSKEDEDFGNWNLVSEFEKDEIRERNSLMR